MVPWTFCFDSTHGLADFIEYHAVFLPTSHLYSNYQYLDEHEVESLDTQALLFIARQIGRDTWGARQALKEFIEGEASFSERELLLQSVRPSTAVLLARLLKMDSALSIDQVLARPEAAFAFHDLEEEEIRLLRPEIWIKLWEKNALLLAESRKAFDKEQLFLQQRLQEERAALAERGDSIASERLAFLQDLEDRVFLRGERVGIETMEGVSVSI